MSLDFVALKVTFHISAHDEIFSKSLFNLDDVSAGSVPFAKSVVSSAKINISLSISLTISFMSMINTPVLNISFEIQHKDDSLSIS